MEIHCETHLAKDSFNSQQKENTATHQACPPKTTTICSQSNTKVSLPICNMGMLLQQSNAIIPKTNHVIFKIKLSKDRVVLASPGCQIISAALSHKAWHVLATTPTTVGATLSNAAPCLTQLIRLTVELTLFIYDW